MGHQLEDLIASWKPKLAICGQQKILNDVEWFVVQHLGRLDSLGAYFLRDEQSVTGYGFFLRQNRPLLGYLGEIKILSIPLRCVRFVEPPHFPEETNAYDQILESLTTLGAMDGFFIRSLRLDSFLWTYLRTSPLIRRNFHVYLPTMRSHTTSSACRKLSKSICRNFPRSRGVIFDVPFENCRRIQARRFAYLGSPRPNRSMHSKILLSPFPKRLINGGSPVLDFESRIC